MELDGGREGPLDRGKTTGETFLEVSPGRSFFSSSTLVFLLFLFWLDTYTMPVRFELNGASVLTLTLLMFSIDL